MIQAVSSAISVGLDDGKNFILLDTRTHVTGLNWWTEAIESALFDTMNGYIQEKWSFVIQTIIVLQNNQKQIHQSLYYSKDSSLLMTWVRQKLAHRRIYLFKD